MPRPNVLVVLTDQQRADTVEPTSGCHTPHLERLADRGVRFERCYAPNTVCSPSRGSIMTGELPHSHGMTHVSHTVPDHQARFQADLPTWSERLDASGYETGYIGKWHVERQSGPSGFGFDLDLHYGSEEFAHAIERYRDDHDLDAAFRSNRTVADRDADDVYRPADGTIDEDDLDLSYTLRDPGYRDSLLYGTHAGPVERRRDHFAYERAQTFIRERADTTQPWCLVVSSFGPHDPFVVPREYFDRYDPSTIELPETYNDDLSDHSELYRRMQAVWSDMEERHAREMMACYWAYCTYLDERIGTLLETLEETGQQDDTVVAMTSDHGEQLGAHGLSLKGAAAFEESYRVPLIIAHPDGPSGQVCPTLAQSLDLAPTIVDVAGAESLECYGTSVAPVVRGEQTETERDVALGEFFGQRYFWTHRVLWDDRYKFVFNPAGVDELYDLEADPTETENLAARGDPESRAIVERMTRRLFAELRETGDETLVNTDYPTLRYAPVGPHPFED